MKRLKNWYYTYLTLFVFGLIEICTYSLVKSNWGISDQGILSTGYGLIAGSLLGVQFGSFTAAIVHLVLSFCLLWLVLALIAGRKIKKLEHGSN